MNVIDIKEARRTKLTNPLWELQDELNKLFQDPKYDDVTVAECLGLLEMFKWEWIQTLEPRD
jgi:hypothetical protein